MKALVIIAALATAAYAGEERYTPEIIHEQVAQTNWKIEAFYDQGFFGTRGVQPDGRHIGLSFTRDRETDTPVVIFRRALKPNETATGHPVRVVEHNGSILAKQFLQGEPIDAATTPLSIGSTAGVWTVVASTNGDSPAPIVDEVEADTSYIYVLAPAVRGGKADTYVSFPGDAIQTWSLRAHTALFDRHRWMHLALILIIGGALALYTWLARRKNLFVRRIAGVDAIEDAIGRSTEMGRPVLYVTGVEEAQDIQTIASLLILGHVAKITAEYDTELRVANAFPLTMVVAEEIVRQGYANAGRADMHRPENVMFITSEQFAFAAGVNGMILRERPATNIYFGRFYAESLMLAETGFLTGAVQIAGTAELTQLPFFISACDFTLLGEELFACSAYLTREPNELALLKAGDVMKVVIAILVVGFTICATLASNNWYPFTRFSIEDVMP